MSAGVLVVVSFQLHMLHNYMHIFNMVHLHRHLYQIREHPLSIANLLYSHYRKHFGNPGVGEVMRVPLAHTSAVLERGVLLVWP